MPGRWNRWGPVIIEIAALALPFILAFGFFVLILHFFGVSILDAVRAGMIFIGLKPL
jgi:hypothetical protein